MSALSGKLTMSPSKRLFIIMAATLVLLLGSGVAIVVVGNKMLKNESNKLLNLKLEGALLDSKQTALVKATKDLQDNKELADIAKAIVPQDKDQAQAVREIVKIAQDSGIVLSQISFPTSTLGTKAPIVAAPAPAATDTKTPAAGTTPTAPTPAPLNISQAKPVQGITGVYSIDMNVKPAFPTDYAHFITFLDKLEHNRRTAQVTSIKISPDIQSNNHKLTFELTLTTYIKP
jgi:hypothetical protein